MSNSNAPKIIFQYFWVKVASKAEVNRQRLERLSSEEAFEVRPETTTTVPRPLRVMSTANDAVARLSVDIGVKLDMKEVELHGSYVEIYLLDSGYDGKPEDWIKTDAGRAWKGKAFCFLAHASVESL